MGIVDILLDKAKETCSPSNDAALAAALGVEKSAVSNWRNGRAYPNVVACEQIAQMIGAKPLQVISAINEARAVSKAEKAVWRRLATSAAALFVLLATTTLPGIGARDAHAQDGAAFRVTQASSAYYVKPGKAFLTLIGDVLRWLRWRFTGRKPGPDNIEAFAA